MNVNDPANMVEFSRPSELTERYVNLIPTVGHADRFVAGLRPSVAKALARLDYFAQMRLLHLLVKSVLFIRPLDQSAVEVADSIARFAREVVEVDHG